MSSPQRSIAEGAFYGGRSDSENDTDGKEKILYHNGYVNYTETMKKVMEQAGINDADTVLVTGYSAGGFGPAG